MPEPWFLPVRSANGRAMESYVVRIYRRDGKKFRIPVGSAEAAGAGLIYLKSVPYLSLSRFYAESERGGVSVSLAHSVDGQLARRPMASVNQPK